MTASPENHPRIQQLAKATHDIVTPANIISVTGLALSLYGATHINEMSGVLQYGAGRVLDLTDGAVARRTYSSRLGEKVDAVADKLAVTAALIGAYATESVPLPIIGSVAAFNIINAAANSYTEARDEKASSSRYGKYGMFGQNLTLGAFLIANAAGESSLWKGAGTAFALLSLPASIKASYDYTRQALRHKNKDKV
jgi:phosphatidylglycerophosphate synthase